MDINKILKYCRRYNALKNSYAILFWAFFLTFLCNVFSRVLPPSKLTIMLSTATFFIFVIGVLVSIFYLISSDEIKITKDGRFIIAKFKKESYCFYYPADGPDYLSRGVILDDCNCKFVENNGEDFAILSTTIDLSDRYRKDYQLEDNESLSIIFEIIGQFRSAIQAIITESRTYHINTYSEAFDKYTERIFRKCKDSSSSKLSEIDFSDIAQDLSKFHCLATITKTGQKVLDDENCTTIDTKETISF